MNLKELKQRPGIEENKKLNRAYLQFGKLISELTTRELPDELVTAINQDIEELNAISDTGKELKAQLKRKQARILKSLEKELKLVPKDYYRNVWLSIGMAAFGLPIGVAFGASFGNMAFLGVGLPIGMAIGIALGTGMDKKAFDEGRQLDLEIR